MIINLLDEGLSKDLCSRFANTRIHTGHSYSFIGLSSAAGGRPDEAEAGFKSVNLHCVF